MPIAGEQKLHHRIYHVILWHEMISCYCACALCKRRKYSAKTTTQDKTQHTIYPLFTDVPVYRLRRPIRSILSKRTNANLFSLFLDGSLLKSQRQIQVLIPIPEKSRKYAHRLAHAYSEHWLCDALLISIQCTKIKPYLLLQAVLSTLFALHSKSSCVVWLRALRLSHLSHTYLILSVHSHVCVVRTIKSRLQNGFARSGRESRVEIVCALK